MDSPHSVKVEIARGENMAENDRPQESVGESIMHDLTTAINRLTSAINAGYVVEYPINKELCQELAILIGKLAKEARFYLCIGNKTTGNQTLVYHGPELSLLQTVRMISDMQKLIEENKGRTEYR
jgi:hypothetical protein